MNSTTAPAAARQRKPRPKPARSIRLCVKPGELSVGVVNIRVGDLSQDYLLEEIRADFGRGFSLKKVGYDEEYHVNLNGRESSCTCKGATLGRSGRCKHSDGLAALIAAGRL